MLKELKLGRVFVGRVAAGEDALAAITRFVQEKQIALGKVSGIGALSRVEIGYFDGKRYHYKEFEESVEVASLEGNISRKGAEIFCHLHINVVDKKFNSYGGHLSKSEVFCLEFVIQEFLGDEYVRLDDQEIPLAVWDKKIY